MSDTAEDLQEGSALGSLRARPGRGGGVGGGELPRIETREVFERGKEVDLEEDGEENISSLCARLSLLLEDLLACDVQLSLFVAACCSYRQDSTLRPFPPMFMVEGERDVESLLAAVKELPSLTEVLKLLEEGKLELNMKDLKLLVWVLSGGPSNLHLRSLSKTDAAEAMSLADATNHPPPSHVLAVTTSSSNRWMADSRDKKTFWAFHGSRLDNFYSILNYGLQQHRTKVSLFGEGIYLCEDLGVCLAYSSRGVGWPRSVLGSSISCLALAQVLDHPSVKLHTEDRDRGAVEGSEGGRVPDKYIVVRNNELLHIRYLLVYKHSAATLPLTSNWLVVFMNKHRMLLLLVAYMAMLGFIGLSNSTWVQRWLRRLR